MLHPVAHFSNSGLNSREDVLRACKMLVDSFSACQPDKNAVLPREVFAKSPLIPDYSSIARVISSARTYAQAQTDADSLLDLIENTAAKVGVVVNRSPSVSAASTMFRRKADMVAERSEAPEQGVSEQPTFRP